MNVNRKIKWIVGILMIFVLIITTNLIDKNNFRRVRDSVVTIYEDRLIANDIIFEMQKALHQKEIALVQSDSAYFTMNQTKANKSLEALVAEFKQTKLTVEEEKVFDDLRNNLQLLSEPENQLLKSNFSNSTEVADQIKRLKTNLDELAKIQLNEGSNQMSISKRALDTVELFTQIEIYILVVLAILAQIILMYKPKEKA